MKSNDKEKADKKIINCHIKKIAGHEYIYSSRRDSKKVISVYIGHSSSCVKCITHKTKKRPRKQHDEFIRCDKLLNEKKQT